MRDAHERQAIGLLEGGVDVLLIETQFDLLGCKAALNGCRRAMATVGREVPIQERFFLGGDASLRGFVQNEVGEPAGGNAFLVVSFEPRLRVFGPVAVAAFVDAGQVVPHYSRWKTYDMRVTPGAGLRVKTPIGPLRLDVGVPVDSRSREDGEGPEVHFSVGYPF